MLSPISANLAAIPSATAAAVRTPPAAPSQPSAVAASAAPETPTSTPASSAPSRATAPDSATISNAAKLALQESRETQSQTMQEANRGDMQAKHLLAKLAAQKAAMQT